MARVVDRDALVIPVPSRWADVQSWSMILGPDGRRWTATPVALLPGVIHMAITPVGGWNSAPTVIAVPDDGWCVRLVPTAAEATEIIMRTFPLTTIETE